MAGSAVPYPYCRFIKKLLQLQLFKLHQRRTVIDIFKDRHNAVRRAAAAQKILQHTDIIALILIIVLAQLIDKDTNGAIHIIIKPDDLLRRLITPANHHRALDVFFLCQLLRQRL